MLVKVRVVGVICRGRWHFYHTRTDNKPTVAIFVFLFTAQHWHLKSSINHYAHILNIVLSVWYILFICSLCFFFSLLFLESQIVFHWIVIKLTDADGWCNMSSFWIKAEVVSYRPKQIRQYSITCKVGSLMLNIGFKTNEGTVLIYMVNRYPNM